MFNPLALFVYHSSSILGLGSGIPKTKLVSLLGVLGGVRTQEGRGHHSARMESMQLHQLALEAMEWRTPLRGGCSARQAAAHLCTRAWRWGRVSRQVYAWAQLGPRCCCMARDLGGAGVPKDCRRRRRAAESCRILDLVVDHLVGSMKTLYSAGPPSPGP